MPGLDPGIHAASTQQGLPGRRPPKDPFLSTLQSIAMARRRVKPGNDDAKSSRLCLEHVHSHMSSMSKPLTVSIPHRLGKDEAVRRLKSGLADVRSNYSHLFNVQDETWTGDQLAFRISALAQTVSGTIDVADDHVTLQVVLPWLLAKLAEAIQPLIRREGTLLLEKK
jgi:hypothetical protein